MLKKLTAPKPRKPRNVRSQPEKKAAVIATTEALNSAARAGRPPDYQASFAVQAKDLCALGATNTDLANFFGVTHETIYAWQSQHREFSDALKLGKDEADGRVERALFHRAVGYSHEAVKIFMPAGAVAPVEAPYIEHTPPDTTAGIFWLKNRKPKEWRDRVEHTGADGGAIVIVLDEKDSRA